MVIEILFILATMSTRGYLIQIRVLNQRFSNEVPANLRLAQCRCVSSSLPPLNTEDIATASNRFNGVSHLSNVNSTSAGSWASSTLAKVPFCGKFNPICPPGQLFIDTQCEARAMREFSNASSIRLNCDCKIPCVETSYRRDTSYAYWPADYAQGTLYRKFVLENSNRDSMKAYTNLQQFNVSELVERGLIQKNFVRLNVYIETLLTDEIIQKPSYSFFNLISDIGGTFGLWISMSLLTWGEVFELGIHLLLRWIKKLLRQRSILNCKASLVADVAAATAICAGYDENHRSSTNAGEMCDRHFITLRILLILIG